MLRHVIAPAHSYAQIPNVILRHPRLSSDAKNLLNWQLSLPSDEKQCLSQTAAKAGIRKCAFQKAKRQLIEERYLHEWTVQKEGGRFATVQLVSNKPLSAKEALAVRDGLRPAPDGARLSARAGAGDGGQPSARNPAAGEPTGPSVGRPPEENTRENTTQPTGPDAGAAAEPEEPGPEGLAGGTAIASHEPGREAAGHDGGAARGGLAAAEALLLSLGRLDPQFAMPARTARRWAPLAAEWLAGGLSPLRIRNALTEGLEDARKPLGALRWRLEHAMPEVPLPPPAAPEPAGPRAEPRTARMRECPTRHIQPRLFTPPPGSDEKLCPDCRSAQASPPALSESSGYAVFVAARQAQPPVSPRAQEHRARQGRLRG